MDQTAANAICANFTGATLEFPFGPEPNVWKVGNKIFAITNAPNGVSLKCADGPTADLLIDMGRAKKAPYLPRGGWILIEWDTMDTNEVAERLATSYATVHSSLTKKAQAELE
jgi:predicted DNA-binding protein (MmcQ/YjbR family)